MADLLDSHTPTSGATAPLADAGRAAAAPPASSAGRRLLPVVWEAVRAGGWRLATLPLLAAALCVAVVLATAIGAVAISPAHTAAILLNQTHLFHFAPSWPHSDEIILLQLRLPRVAGAALVGAALGVSGALFQGLLRNPLADPLLLGSSAGAALGATLSFLLPAAFTAEFLGFSLVTVAAFAGALLAVALVYRLATRRGQTPVVTLLLAGVAITSILAAVQTLLVTLNDRLALRITSLYLWNAGGVAVRDWAQVQVVLALVLAGVAGALYFARALDAFALGEGMAAHLGVRVERAKLSIVAVASLLVAAAVSISGLVSFVGLVSPHFARLLLGPRNRLLVPATALLGALFVVLADLLARTLAAPAELPLDVITALVGAPFFLSLLRYAGQRYRW